MVHSPLYHPTQIALADDPEQEALDRIAIVSQQAKTAWFGLLAALVFVTVTLMGHRDADFFAFGAATTLPVIGVDVPPEAFFVAAPVLITALYVYLHLYLLNLWEALAEAPPVIRGKPLAKRAYPTMITTWALGYRQRRRRDGCAERRAMGWLNSWASLILVWLFAWFVMAGLWWRSMPVHDPWLTYPLGGLLFVLIAVGVRSYANAGRRLADRGERRGWWHIPLRALWRLPLLLLVVFVSYVRIDGEELPSEKVVADWVQGVSGVEPHAWLTSDELDLGSDKFAPFLARADLAEQDLTVRPEGFRDHAEWMEDFEHQFREREGIALGADMSADDRRRFEAEAKTRRRARLDSLQKRSLRGRDLRRARVADAFLTAADLRGARMAREARMEGADLSRARMEGANLSWARMEGADLRGARMEGADLRGARMEGADLREARMEGADLMRGRGWRGRTSAWRGWRGRTSARRGWRGRTSARRGWRGRTSGGWRGWRGRTSAGRGWRGRTSAGRGWRGWRGRTSARGWKGRLFGMEGADLGGARMEGANLSGAQLKSADLRDWSIVRTSLRSADFTEAKNLTQAAVNSAFGDSGTVLPAGIAPPCHWAGVEPLGPFDPGLFDLAEDQAYQAWLAKWDGDTPPPCPEAGDGAAPGGPR